MSDAKVTIGIATYNHANFLSECLDSALSQTYRNLEVLVLDDCSVDGTSQVLDRYESVGPMKILRNKTNKGITLTYHRLLASASGHYFMILGDDDRLQEDYVERMVQLLENNPRCRIALGSNMIMNESGKVVKKLESQLKEYVEGLEIVDMWLSESKRINQHSFIMMMGRKSDFKEAGGFPHFAMGQHSCNALFMRLALQGEVGYDRQTSYHYRVYSQSYGNRNVIEVGQASAQFLGYFDSQFVPLAIHRLGQTRLTIMRRSLEKLLVKIYYTRIVLYYSPTHRLSECVRLFAKPPLSVRKLIFFPRFILKYFRFKLSNSQLA